MAWIAIDAGTSVIKAVAYMDNGREAAVARRPAEVLHSRANFSEQEMESVWNAVVETVRTVASQLEENIRGIVSTAQGDGCWLVDKHGKPIGNAILWNDGRAAEIVGRWHEDGKVEQSFHKTGSVTYPGLPNAIFAWLEKEEPERLRRACWSLTCNGWLHARLTGRFVADLSDASNPFSDVVREEYSPEVLDIYEAGEYTALLPPVVKGHDTNAPLTETAAKELGLQAGMPVVIAPYDIVSTAYGSGAALNGQACVILGTTICAEVITESLNVSSAPSGTTIALSDGMFLRALPTLTGCEALDWAASLLQIKGLVALGELAAQSEAGSGGIYFLPYLSTAGERSPFLDPAAKGSFHGLSLLTTRSQMARAVYEGLSFVIHECLETAARGELKEVRVCGGGACSDLWCQMIADVIGITVIRSADSEAGARGAYLFALAVTGETKSVTEDVSRFAREATTFQPSLQAHCFYTGRFTTFRRLRDLATEQWHLLEGRR